LFDEAGLQYALIGGMAVNAWVVPRFTADIDFVVEAEPVAVRAAEERLLSAGFRYLRRQDAGGASGPDFIRMQQDATGAVIDLQAAKTPFQTAIVARAVLDPSGVRIATPEDLIVLKLIAGRSRDQRDLAELLALSGLDWRYIEREAMVWGLGDRLRAARAAVAGEDRLP
jgi:hypothetical protein